MKIFRAKQQLVASGFGWAQDFSPTAIRLIGVAEILGAIGLILRAAMHIAPILVSLAAVGLPLRLCEWLLRNSFRGTVRRRTGEVVTDLLCEQVQVTLVMPGWE
jgi:hypothetical protein